MQCPFLSSSLSLLKVGISSSKEGPTWLLLWWEERGDWLVSQCVLVLCTMLSLCSLSLFFGHCHLSSLLVARLLFLCTMSLFFALCHWALNLLSLVSSWPLFSSHNVIVSLLYVILSSHCVASQWFFALSHCFFALSHQLLSCNTS